MFKIDLTNLYPIFYNAGYRYCDKENREALGKEMGIKADSVYFWTLGYSRPSAKKLNAVFEKHGYQLYLYKDGVFEKFSLLEMMKIFDREAKKRNMSMNSLSTELYDYPSCISAMIRKNSYNISIDRIQYTLSTLGYELYLETGDVDN